MDYGRQLLRFTDEMIRQSRVEIARTRALRDVTRETICDTRAGIAECRRLAPLLGLQYFKFYDYHMCCNRQ